MIEEDYGYRVVIHIPHADIEYLKRREGEIGAAASLGELLATTGSRGGYVGIAVTVVMGLGVLAWEYIKVIDEKSGYRGCNLEYQIGLFKPGLLYNLYEGVKNMVYDENERTLGGVKFKIP